MAYNLEVGDDTPLLYNDFCRLRFVNSLLQDESTYQHALRQLIERHSEHPLTAEVALELANSLLKLFSSSPDENTDPAYYHETAHLCYEVVAKFPQAKSSEKTTHILDELYETEFRISMTRVQLPEENIPVVLSYRNMRRAYL